EGRCRRTTTTEPGRCNGAVSSFIFTISLPSAVKSSPLTCRNISIGCFKHRCFYICDYYLRKRLRSLRKNLNKLNNIDLKTNQTKTDNHQPSPLLTSSSSSTSTRPDFFGPPPPPPNPGVPYPASERIFYHWN
ncbi:hypothetical protein Ahia01_001286400, partial [Argonauta hians]